MSARVTITTGVCGGKPCVAGHRVRVSDVVAWHEHQGLSADAIVSQVPGLTLADVYAALAYYYENVDSIRKEMRAELAAAKRYQRDGDSVLAAKVRRGRRAS